MFHDPPITEKQRRDCSRHSVPFNLIAELCNKDTQWRHFWPEKMRSYGRSFLPSPLKIDTHVNRYLQVQGNKGLTMIACVTLPCSTFLVFAASFNRATASDTPAPAKPLKRTFGENGSPIQGSQFGVSLDQTLSAIFS